MGIESKHPYYENASDQWSRIRDSFNGSDAIKSQDRKYLPQLGGQEKSQYDAYKLRAVYYNGIERTVRGLVGAVMRVDPIIEVPAKLEPLLDDITGTGISLNDFISYMLSEQLLMNRQGILVDRNEERPYLVGFPTEQITNWIDDAIVIQESYRQVDPRDKYKSEYATQYRELTLDEDGKYVVRIWRDSNGWKVWDEIYPTQRGEGLEGIPFISISGDGFNLDPVTPSLLALADTGLSLYRTSADLEHGRHFTALPTPYVTGIDLDSELTIGSGTAWILPDASSKAGYLEFTGQGLKALEVAMEEKRTMMASLGAQLLQSQKAGIESADSVRLRQNAEASTLISTVKTVERAITQAVQVMAGWEGLSDEVTITLNTDFVDTKIEPQAMTSLMGAWQSGAISHDTFLFNMKRGEVLPPDVSIEEEKSLIDVQAGDFEVQAGEFE
jgi:hypothetical protein